MDLTKSHQPTLGETIERELARLDVERASWRLALARTDTIAKQINEFTQGDSAYSQIANELTATRSAASQIGPQLKDVLGVGSVVGQAFKAWQESQRTQQEHIRKMLVPLADIREHLMLDSTTQQLMKELALGASVRDQFKDVLDGFSGMGSAAKMWAQQIEEMRAQTRSAFEAAQLGSSLQASLKDFERINKQWRVPSEVLGVVGSLHEIQDQLGKVTLPTIDWGSAAALAKLLGEAGFEEQLAHLGIERDGSLTETKESPGKGLLSRKQSDAVALVGLLLTIIGIWMTIQIFFHQESAGAAQQAKNDEHAAKQLRQLESLNRLVENALEEATNDHEERLVVRQRTATVRSKPSHGAVVEGKLLPNEVVRPLSRDGKWVEVEYYHWLHEEYRTGWVLKKYLERVPANYSKSSK